MAARHNENNEKQPSASVVEAVWRRNTLRQAMQRIPSLLHPVVLLSLSSCHAGNSTNLEQLGRGNVIDSPVSQPNYGGSAQVPLSLNNVPFRGTVEVGISHDNGIGRYSSLFLLESIPFQEEGAITFTLADNLGNPIKSESVEVLLERIAESAYEVETLALRTSEEASISVPLRTRRLPRGWTQVQVATTERPGSGRLQGLITAEAAHAPRPARTQVTMSTTVLLASGKLITSSGAAVAGCEIFAYRADKTEAKFRARLFASRPITDETGQFQVYGLNDGSDLRLDLVSERVTLRTPSRIGAGSEGVVLVCEQVQSIRGRLALPRYMAPSKCSIEFVFADGQFMTCPVGRAGSWQGTLYPGNPISKVVVRSTQAITPILVLDSGNAESLVNDALSAKGATINIEDRYFPVSLRVVDGGRNAITSLTARFPGDTELKNVASLELNTIMCLEKSGMRVIFRARGFRPVESVATMPELVLQFQRGPELLVMIKNADLIPENASLFLIAESQYPESKVHEWLMLDRPTRVQLADGGDQLINIGMSTEGQIGGRIIKKYSLVIIEEVTSIEFDVADTQ